MQLIEEFTDMPADFGRSIPATGLKAYVMAMDSSLNENGCEGMLGPSTELYPTDSKFAIIIKRFHKELFKLYILLNLLN